MLIFPVLWVRNARSLGFDRRAFLNRCVGWSYAQRTGAIQGAPVVASEKCPLRKMLGGSDTDASASMMCVCVCLQLIHVTAHRVSGFPQNRQVQRMYPVLVFFSHGSNTHLLSLVWKSVCFSSCGYCSLSVREKLPELRCSVNALDVQVRCGRRRQFFPSRFRAFSTSCLRTVTIPSPKLNCRG